MHVRPECQIALIGLGRSGGVVVCKATIKNKKGVRYIAASEKIDDLQSAQFKDKIFVREPDSVHGLLRLVKTIPTIVVVGDTSALPLCIKLIRHLALLACHLIFMIFVYQTIFKIQIWMPEKFKLAVTVFPVNERRQYLETNSSWEFSKIKERSVTPLLSSADDKKKSSALFFYS